MNSGTVCERFNVYLGHESLLSKKESPKKAKCKPVDGKWGTESALGQEISAFEYGLICKLRVSYLAPEFVKWTLESEKLGLR